MTDCESCIVERNGMFNFTQPPPLSLYVHLPWCVRKCPYCDFNSYAAGPELPEQAYVRALVRDLDTECGRIAGRRIDSIFIGGGTPSLFSPDAVAALLEAVHARLAVATGAEITLEANPGTFESRRFYGYRCAGINRLSIGVQSLDTVMLRAIGRIHSGEEALGAFHGAREAGFDNINVDLMYALPGQDVGGALTDVETVARLGPEHISHYQLTIEPQTLFYRQRPPLPDDAVGWDMQIRCQAVLGAHGYDHYEVSAYARPGHRCRHNLNYWRYGDYLGIGAGAHGKLTDVAAQRIERTWKTKNPRLYLQRAGGPHCTAGRQTPTRHDAAFEFLLNALRLVEGFDIGVFRRHTGLDPSLLAGPLAAAREKGLIQGDGRRLRATPAGQRYLDDLLQLFLP